jgi:hypothetical protein
MATQNMQKHDKQLVCELCDYKCSRMFCMQQHLSTTKHINATKKVHIATSKYVCSNCDKVFKHHSSMYRHQTKCNIKDALGKDIVVELLKQNQDFKQLIIDQNNKLEQQNKLFVEQNQDLQQQIIDICKNGITNNNTINNVNSHNKTFNLQVFLNEDCKDAMNITDFVDSIKFQLADLEHMGRVGYVEGISNIIIRNLKALDVTKRPVHCTDQKRETIYIKDAGVWTKEDEDNKNVRKLIKKVAFRNSKCIRLFKEKHPDCITSESKYSDTYSKIVIEAMGGGSKCNDYDSENKIIRKIAKEMTIDKIHL